MYLHTYTYMYMFSGEMDHLEILQPSDNDVAALVAYYLRIYIYMCIYLYVYIYMYLHIYIYISVLRRDGPSRDSVAI